jgi:hypothetical protein
MKRSKFSVEECSRLNVTRDLFRMGMAKFGGWSSGTWKRPRCFGSAAMVSMVSAEALNRRS